jgi:hypothetical protein
MANTGNKIYTNLLKVVNGGLYDGLPLDINNQLISISGLSQDAKANTSGQPDYILPNQDLNKCPLSSVNVIAVSEVYENPSSNLQVVGKITLNKPLGSTVTFYLQYLENNSNYQVINVTVILGQLIGLLIQNKVNPTSTVTFDKVIGVSENPVNGTIISY